jgi:hypothetical protein
MAALLACPACNCHFRVGEPACPHCGAILVRETHKLARAAGSLALGLIAATVPIGCRSSVVVVGAAGGAGGASETQSQSHASVQSSSHTSTTVQTVSQASSSTYGCGPTCDPQCDSIGVCKDPSNMGDPTKGCIDCALSLGGAFSDAGSCVIVAQDAYGSDGKCMMGGHPAACAFVTCENACFMTDPSGMLQSTWDCFCTNDKMGSASKCSPIAMQTDTNTCLGKLATDMPALNAESAFEMCVYQIVCPGSCSPPGG